MAPGMSLGQLQWLLYCQQTDEKLTDSSGKRVTLEHYYYRKEYEFHGYDVDGYANVDGRHIFYEFLGCYWHKGCTHCKRYPGEDPEWEEKSRYLRQYGELRTMRECIWLEKLKSIGKTETPYLPDILKKWSNEKDLLNGIQSGRIFGFVICDIICPQEVYDEIKSINFPPIIQRGIIDEDLLSPYMLDRCKSRGYKLPQKTLIQTYNGEQILLYTPLVQFYMRLGLKIKNVTKFVQYKATHPLEPFVQKIVNGRVKAAESGNEPLELAFKIIGNRLVKFYYSKILLY